MAFFAKIFRAPAVSPVRQRSRPSTPVELPTSVPGRDWKLAPADKRTRWFQSTDTRGLDRWIRSPAAPPADRVAALERWIAQHPNRYVLGLELREPPKYHPVGEYLRARIADPVFRKLPLAERVWLALARSAWLGESRALWCVTDFTRHAELPVDALPRIIAETSRYQPRGRDHLCRVFHSRAESTADPAERHALYGSIHRLTSMR